MTTEPLTPGTGGKRPAWKVLLPIALLVLAVVVGLAALKVMIPERPHTAQSKFTLKEGAIAPDFTLTRFQGADVKFSELEGKVFLLNFWATWCEACMVEMPSISKLRETYRDRGFEVLGVNLDENPDLAVSVVRERFGLQFPIFLDAESRLSDLFDVHGIPLTIVLNRQGRILMVETGERDWFGQDVQRKLEGWISE